MSNQLRQMRMSLVPAGAQQANWAQQIMQRIAALPVSLGELARRSREALGMVMTSIGAWSQRMAASRAAIAVRGFFGAAFETLGGGRLNVPFIFILVDENGRPIGMPPDYSSGNIIS